MSRVFEMISCHCFSSVNSLNIAYLMRSFTLPLSWHSHAFMLFLSHAVMLCAEVIKQCASTACNCHHLHSQHFVLVSCVLC